MHYLIQATLGDLQVASVGWNTKGGERYVGFYDAGLAMIAGPLIGNPVLPWFEIQCTNDSILDSLGFYFGLMIDEVRNPGNLRGAYRASIASPRNDRSLIHNSSGLVIGVTPNFVICGTHPVASFLAGEDPEEAEEITGLD